MNAKLATMLVGLLAMTALAGCTDDSSDALDSSPENQPHVPSQGQNPVKENKGSQTTPPSSKSITEVSSIIPVTGPFAPCERISSWLDNGCDYVGILNESLSWSVSSDSSNDTILLVGSIQGIFPFDDPEHVLVWTILHVYVINTKGEQIGYGYLYPWEAFRYLLYGQTSFFYIVIKVGLGEAQFLSHFEFAVNAEDTNYKPRQPVGLSYTVSSAEAQAGNSSIVVIDWTNEDSRSVSGYVFVTTYDADHRAQGIGGVETTIPAAGSTQVTVTTDKYLRTTEPVYYSVHFEQK